MEAHPDALQFPQRGQEVRIYQKGVTIHYPSCPHVPPCIRYDNHYQVECYSELGMVEQERDYCMGIVLGAYRYEKESKSEFKNWCEDTLLYSAKRLLEEWRERTADTTMHNTMDEFIRGRCSGWMD